MKILLVLIDKYKTIKVVKIIVYPAGTCFEKKATHKKNELQNQRKVLFFLIAIIPKKIENKEKQEECKSKNGVPLMGYARIDNEMDNNNDILMFKLRVCKT